jgi:hypothetical protein
MFVQMTGNPAVQENSTIETPTASAMVAQTNPVKNWLASITARILLKIPDFFHRRW